MESSCPSHDFLQNITWDPMIHHLEETPCLRCFSNCPNYLSALRLIPMNALEVYDWDVGSGNIGSKERRGGRPVTTSRRWWSELQRINDSEERPLQLRRWRRKQGSGRFVQQIEGVVAGVAVPGGGSSVPGVFLRPALILSQILTTLKAEPSLLAARIPSLFLNGASGIAVIDLIYSIASHFTCEV
nr:hypothetical protein Itr_chr14CG08330 [Ipomoea trifida]